MPRWKLIPMFTGVVGTIRWSLTRLYDQAREIVLEYLGLKSGRYIVIFCTPRRAASLIKQLKPESYQLVSGLDIGLS